MSKIFTKLWFAARLITCVIIALLNGIAIGLQGNGNLLLTGLFIGLLLGVAWSVLLVFGLPALVRDFHLTGRVALLAALLVVALVLLPIICFHLWGHGAEFTPYLNKYWP
jgi:hypothetical protein